MNRMKKKKFHRKNSQIREKLLEKTHYTCTESHVTKTYDKLFFNHDETMTQQRQLNSETDRDGENEWHCR